MSDFELRQHGGIAVLIARSDAARGWQEEHLPAILQLAAKETPVELQTTLHEMNVMLKSAGIALNKAFILYDLSEVEERLCQHLFALVYGKLNA